MNKQAIGTMAEHLEMEVIDLGEDFIEMKMPINAKNVQPLKLLHGGASIALAENAASLAGNLVVWNDGKACVGLSVNSHHMRSAKSGFVFAKAKGIHFGRSTQIWQVDIRDNQGKQINTSTVTLAVIDR